MTHRIQRIQTILEAEFSPTELQIQDDSHLHAGHAGARSGKGHFTVILSSEKFRDKSLLQCHRLVYDALDEMMQTDIHALSIKASVPE